MIRPAKLSDYKACEILDLAMSEFSENFFNESDYHKKIEKFYEFFGREKSRFALANLFVYEIDSKVVAIACAYGGREYDDRALMQYLKICGSDYEIIKECADDEFYLDSVAVLPSFRGRGILGELLSFLKNIAKERGYKKFSLITKEPKIYERYGFAVACECAEFSGYFKMLKNLNK